MKARPRTLALAVLLACAAACDTPASVAPDAAPAPAGSTQVPTGRAPDEPKPPTTFDVAAIDAYVARALVSEHLVGLSLAIARDGQIVLAKGYGEARREDHVPVGLDTEFGVGSITKQFTCASALLLESDRKLAMTDKVARYFPALTRAGDISLADVGAHVSGYPDYYPLDFVDQRMLEATTQDGILARYATGKLDFEPGSRWSYSNTGFTLLGRVVEKVAGEPLGAVFAKRIFDPVGMTHTAYAPKDGPGVARGYTSFALGDPEPAVREAADWLNGAGAIFASATDLAKWDLALVSGKVLPPPQYARLTTPRVLPDGRST